MFAEQLLLVVVLAEQLLVVELPRAPQRLVEQRAGAEDVRFDRAQRQVEFLGDLFVRLLLLMPQHNHPVILLR